MDTHTTPPTTTARSLDELADIARPLDLTLNVTQLARLARYRDMLHERNQHVNLTAVRDLDGVERRLILESLRLTQFVQQHAGAGRIMDLGSGGGIPGIVLAIALPEFQFTLLDATGKKVQFQRDVIADLGLENVQAVQGRAEELGHDINWRNSFDLVTARAVTSLAALMELGLPFVAMKGWLVLPKGTDIDEEMVIGRKAAGKLGGTVVSQDELRDVGSDVQTRLVLVRKDQATPVSFPRRVGVPAKSPLGSPQDQAERKPRKKRGGA
ncbi:MAG: 16S rRNA (guanine(527)-N(7))-methyltransferase RsmG [Thermomicrobiales bacterium]|nr:16S rRNA (guanine(527)-N(7))-methyltransferase RsmG [Thermomicrobiales bacterium]